MGVCWPCASSRSLSGPPSWLSPPIEQTDRRTALECTKIHPRRRLQSPPRRPPGNFEGASATHSMRTRARRRPRAQRPQLFARSFSRERGRSAGRRSSHPSTQPLFWLFLAAIADPLPLCVCASCRRLWPFVPLSAPARDSGCVWRLLQDCNRSTAWIHDARLCTMRGPSGGGAPAQAPDSHGPIASSHPHAGSRDLLAPYMLRSFLSTLLASFCQPKNVRQLAAPHIALLGDPITFLWSNHVPLPHPPVCASGAQKELERKRRGTQLTTDCRQFSLK